MFKVEGQKISFWQWLTAGSAQRKAWGATRGAEIKRNGAASIDRTRKWGVDKIETTAMDARAQAHQKLVNGQWSFQEYRSFMDELDKTVEDSRAQIMGVK